MYYTVYKTTNTTNGKIYIGMHQTENLDDGYMGSGKYLKRALKKYGSQQFTKEILFVFDTFDEMKTKEREIVDEAFVNRDDTYNLNIGGEGGWYRANQVSTPVQKKTASKLGAIARAENAKLDPHYYDAARVRFRQISIAWNNSGLANHATFTGKKHTADTLLLMRASHVGKNLGVANGRTKLTPEIVQEAQALWIRGSREFGAKALAAKYGVHQSTMADALSGKTWIKKQP